MPQPIVDDPTTVIQYKYKYRLIRIGETDRVWAFILWRISRSSLPASLLFCIVYRIFVRRLCKCIYFITAPSVIAMTRTQLEANTRQHFQKSLMPSGPQGTYIYQWFGTISGKASFPDKKQIEHQFISILFFLILSASRLSKTSIN